MGSVDPCGDGVKTPIAFVGKEQWGEAVLKLAAETSILIVKTVSEEMSLSAGTFREA